MPTEFDSCVKKGGKVRTKRVNKTQYMHLCIMGGKSYPGEVKNYKKLSFRKK